MKNEIELGNRESGEQIVNAPCHTSFPNVYVDQGTTQQKILYYYLFIITYHDLFPALISQ